MPTRKLSARPGVTIASAAASLLLGVGLGAWLFGAPAHAPSEARAPEPAGEALRAQTSALPEAEEVARLRAELALERSMRAQLSEEIARLASDASAAGEAPSERAPEPEDARAVVGGADSDEEQEWFSDDALARLGMEPADIERIRARWERSVMDRLYLNHERSRNKGDRAAQRESIQELHQIRRSLREDLGEADYEAMLYATEQPNRVRFQSLLNDSPAADAGVQQGDEVIRYDGERIFNLYALMAQTRQGEADSWVELEVLRGAELVRLFVRRGPLGVQLDPVSRAPYFE